MIDQATTEIETPRPEPETATGDQAPVSESAPGAPVAEPGLKPWLPAVEYAEETHRRVALVSRRSLSLLWARRGLWLGGAAIVLSFVFTLLLTQDEPMRTRAWVGLIAAGLLAIIAWGRTPWLNAFASPA